MTDVLALFVTVPVMNDDDEDGENASGQGEEADRILERKESDEDNNGVEELRVYSDLERDKDAEREEAEN